MVIAALGVALASPSAAQPAWEPVITVAGVGLSERGNDNPKADSYVSTSPIRFIRDLGAAYRATGRTAPIMDQLVFHPYPENPADDLLKSYAWPSAGFGNLDRIKQALWDAFNGTAQPTVETGLRLRVGEIGWQTQALAAAAGAYTGKETVPATTEAGGVTNASVVGDQARNVAQLAVSAAPSRSPPHQTFWPGGPQASAPGSAG